MPHWCSPGGFLTGEGTGGRRYVAPSGVVPGSSLRAEMPDPRQDTRGGCGLADLGAGLLLAEPGPALVLRHLDAPAGHVEAHEGSAGVDEGGGEVALSGGQRGEPVGLLA